jgi:ATP-dependent helicase/DNAse subunit B
MAVLWLALVYHVDMTGDKYSAVWVSHSSISTFQACPRAYYLKNIYKDPKSGHKIKIMSPPLALGQAVHEVVESLSVLPVSSRFKESLLDKYERAWRNVSGEKGGFQDAEGEYKYKNRGEEMIRRVMKNPGPIAGLAVKINQDLPYYWLSEEDNIILCGKIDWLEYLPETDSVHIIDFKTSKNEEGAESLQLPIYRLLVANCQKRETTRASYWYLEKNNELTPKPLPDLEKSKEKILKIARKMKLARKMEIFKCPQGDGCRECRPFERILAGEGKFVGNDEYRADVYILNSIQKDEEDSKIL